MRFIKIKLKIYLSMIILIINCRELKKPELFLSLLISKGKLGVITSDFSGSGRFHTINEIGILSPNFKPIYSDAVGFYLENHVIIINRLGRDTIQIMDPNFFYQTIAEYSTGNNSNPHGIAFYNEKAYITLYEKNYVLVVDKLKGIELKRIDLSPYIDMLTFFAPDNLPEASGIVKLNNKIYIALQRLDRTNPNYIFPPTDYSLFVEIDPETDAITNTYKMIFTNPSSKLKIYNIFGEDCIYVANPAYVGFNFRVDGGIEGFCPNSKTQHIILKEEEVGGDILDFVIKDSQTGYALVLNEDFSNNLFEFNPQTAKVTRHIIYYSNQNGFAAGLEIDKNEKLYLGESSNYPSIKIYNTNLNYFENVIPLPQRPTEIFLIEE